MPHDALFRTAHTLNECYNVRNYIKLQWMPVGRYCTTWKFEKYHFLFFQMYVVSSIYMIFVVLQHCTAFTKRWKAFCDKTNAFRLSQVRAESYPCLPISRWFYRTCRASIVLVRTFNMGLKYISLVIYIISFF